jgi:hypothetical protein
MSSSSALMCGRPACFASPVYRLPLPRSDRATGRCTSGRQSAMLRHILSALCEMFLSNTRHARRIDTGGPMAWPPRSTPDLNPLDFYLWGHLKTLVYAAPVDNEEALHHRNYPGIFERMLRCMMRRVEACIESHGGYFVHLP